jgi:cytochrome P450
VRPSDFPREERFRNPRTPPFCDEQGVFHVFSYADVTRVLANADEAFTREPSAWLPPGEHHPAFDFMWMAEPFTLDGRSGRHDLLRAIVEPWFRQRAVDTMEGVVKELARELIDGIVAKGVGELNIASELCYPLAIRVICRLMGIELDREPWLREKLNEISQARSFAEVPRQWDLEAYFWQMLAKRIAHPRNELLDILAVAWKDGTISDRELLGYLSGFVLAGTDTTGTALVNAFALLAEFGHLDYTRGILQDHEALAKLIEEVLRYGNPFPVKPLFVCKDTRFGDLDIPAGSVLNAWFVAANRDEEVNGRIEQATATVFDPRRSPNLHVGLGRGRHYCLGAGLARLEIRILLRQVLQRLPNLQLDPDKPFVRFAGTVDGVTAAPFCFDHLAARNAAGD